MKIKMLCLDKNIKFEIKNSGFENISNDSDIYNKEFYKIGKNICEKIYIDNYDYKNVNSNEDIRIILIKDIDDIAINKIEELKGKTSCIILTGNIGAKNKKIREKFEKENNVVKINKLNKEEEINLDLLIFILENKEILHDIKLNKRYTNIIIEKRNSIGDITISLLKQFGQVQHDKEYKFYLYSKEYINLQELSYLEDPIREYISNDSKLLINNLVSEIIDDESLGFISISK